MTTDSKEDPKNDPTKEVDSSDGDSKSATLGEVKTIVNEAVASLKSLLGGKGDPIVEGGDKPKENEGGKPAPVGGMRSTMEREARRMVEEAAATLKGEEDHRKAHEQITEAAKAPAAKEDNPIKVRKLTKFLFGDPS